MKEKIAPDKIVIRRACPEDAAEFCRIFSAPVVCRETLQVPFPSIEEWRGRLEEKDANRYQLVAGVEGRVVGTAGLHLCSGSPRRRHVARIGMAVHDDFQQQGIGAALLSKLVELADRWLDIKCLELTVNADNQPAIKLYEKFGFEIEGRHQAYAFREGEFADALAMARIRGLNT